MWNLHLTSFCRYAQFGGNYRTFHYSMNKQTARIFVSVRAFHRWCEHSSTQLSRQFTHCSETHHSSQYVSGLKIKLESDSRLLKKVLLVHNKLFQWQKYHDKVSLSPQLNSSASQFRSDYTWKCLKWNQRGDQGEKPVGEFKWMSCELKWKKDGTVLNTTSETWKTMPFKMHEVLNHTVLVICFL